MAVEHYLGSIGILDYADSLTVKGVPLSRVMVAMSTHILMGSNSMSCCSDWLKDRNVRKEFGLDEGLFQWKFVCCHLKKYSSGS